MRPQSGITIYERTSAISVADAKLKRPTMGGGGHSLVAEALSFERIESDHFCDSGMARGGRLRGNFPKKRTTR
jgi:hypothetical protein